MRRLVSVAFPLAFLFLSTVPTLAQEARPPELEVLNGIVGDWVYQSGASGTWECDWHGEYFVVCQDEGVSAAGSPYSTIEIFGWNARQEWYTYQRFQAGGGHQVFNGFKKDNVIVWNRTGRYAGFGRITNTFEPSGDFSYKWENTPSLGAPWEVTLEGSLTKVR